MRICHLTINTERFEEEIAFYCEIAGLEIVRELHTPDKDIVFLANGEGETQVEIIKDAEARCSGTEYISIGFFVENVEEKREELVAKGYEATPVIYAGGGTRFFFVKDPAGVRVQFI